MLLQIGAAITNYSNSYHKIGQLLQIGVKYITNCGNYYKLGHNKDHRNYSSKTHFPQFSLCFYVILLS